MLKTNFKKENGITLIALGVTIVVLSILAGVTIAAITGDNGILKQARNARDTAESAKDEEDSLIDDLIGKLDEEDKSLIPEDLPDIGDAPVLENKDLDEILSLDYIPIYTTEQYQAISTGVTGYEIFDLNNNSVGTFDMLVSAKYALMNDLDFSSSGNVEPIKNFEGEFNGNGHTVKNLTIDKSSSTETYPLTSGASGTMDVPAAMFDVVHGANIHDIYIDNINVKGKRTVAALVGEGNLNVIIDNCYVSNSTITSTGKFSTAGIIGYIHNRTSSYNAKITNCRVSNTNFSCADRYSYIGGIISTAMSNLEISNCNVLDIDSNISAGIIYDFGGSGCAYKITITNSNVQNISIIQAGIISHFDATSLTIENCNVKDISASSPDTECAGILRYANDDVTIRNCNVQSFSISGSAWYVGGIISTCENGYPTIENCTIRDFSFNSPIPFSLLGGIIGYSEYNATIVDCIVSDVNIESFVEPYSGYGYFGGILGLTQAYDLSIDNCSVEFVVLSDNSTTNVGGIVGLFRGGSINNCTVSTCDLFGSSQVGGIVGMTDNSSSGTVSINNCIVQNTKLSCRNNLLGGIIGFLGSHPANNTYAISDCLVKNCELSGKTDIGGIIGMSFDSRIIGLKSCNVESTKISGESRVGGIMGFLGANTYLEYCNVSNCEIESTVIACGGIVGHGQNIDFSVRQKIENCNVSSTTIKGLDEVGGICGASTTTITACNVTDSSIIATGQYVGGIQGTAGSDSYAEITNCHVKSTDISGAEDVGDIQGKGGYDASTGALLGNDVITNCTRE